MRVQLQLVSYWVVRQQDQPEDLIQHVILEMLIHLLKLSMINHYSLKQVLFHTQIPLLRPMPTHALIRLRLLQREFKLLKLIMREQLRPNGTQSTHVIRRFHTIRDSLPGETLRFVRKFSTNCTRTYAPWKTLLKHENQNLYDLRHAIAAGLGGFCWPKPYRGSSLSENLAYAKARPLD